MPSPATAGLVLVVSEKEASRHLIAHLLAVLGIPALSAGSVAEIVALLRARRTEVRLALVSDPPEALEVLQRTAPGLRCCVLAGDMEAETRAVAAGADVVLREPFQLRELLCCVRPVRASGFPSSLRAWPGRFGRLVACGP